VATDKFILDIEIIKNLKDDILNFNTNKKYITYKNYTAKSTDVTIYFRC